VADHLLFFIFLFFIFYFFLLKRLNGQFEKLNVKEVTYDAHDLLSVYFEGQNTNGMYNLIYGGSMRVLISLFKF
jgi:hypothetical protein